MRLIDADRLKIVFDKNIGNPQVKKVFNQYVDTQPTINNWIPVSEKLPDGKEDSYLVTRTDGKFTWVEEGDFVIDEFLFIGDEYRFNLKRKIENIAWMPLPEPYKENTDD